MIQIMEEKKEEKKFKKGIKELYNFNDRGKNELTSLTLVTLGKLRGKKIK